MAAPRTRATMAAADPVVPPVVPPSDMPSVEEMTEALNAYKGYLDADARRFNAARVLLRAMPGGFEELLAKAAHYEQYTKDLETQAEGLNAQLANLQVAYEVARKEIDDRVRARRDEADKEIAEIDARLQAAQVAVGKLHGVQAVLD
jgi:hypothetical protein